MGMFVKDPDSAVDHAVDWDAGYLAGRQISQSQWQVQPAGGAMPLQLANARQTAGRTAVTISGGQPGLVYRVTNRIGLSDGSSDERTLVVRVEER